MKLSPIRIGIIVSTLATAFLHLTLISYGLPPFDPIILNGLGYFGLLAAYFLPIAIFQDKHKLVWWAFVGYTVLTIILWAVLGDLNFVAGTKSAIGYYAKAAEVALLVFLWLDKPRS